jgi:hypothetical protein
MSDLCLDDDLACRIAAELEQVRRMLDRMGDHLSGDMEVLMRHGVPLQTVDIAGQILGHIANIVRADDAVAAVDRIGMCELKARLQQSEAA